MSLNARDFTQGGQVLKYMIGMFLQIMNIASYWIFLLSALAFLGWMFIRMSLEQLLHGGTYWLIKWFVLPFRKLASNGNPYTFHYTRADGSVISLKRTAEQVMADPYFQAVGTLFKDTAFWGWGIASFTFVGTMFAVMWYLGRKGRLQRENEMLGGRELVTDVKVVNKLLKAQDKLSPLAICGLHLVKYSEMQGIALHGTVGVGKSTVIYDLLVQIRKNGDRAIVYDKGNNFIPIFYRQDRDEILCPLDQRCAGWDLWEECQSSADFENFTVSLIPDSGHGDPFWLLSARSLFAAAGRRMARDPERSIANLMKKLLSITLADLREYLKGTDAANLVEGSIEKTAMTIRSVLTSYVRALRYLQGVDEMGKRPFNLRDWIATEDMQGDNPWIFIPSDGRNHNALKPLLSAWIYLVMVNILGLKADRDRNRRIWLVLDEIPTLHKLPILPEFIAETRKFGGCTLIGLQNFPQLEEQYGVHFAADIWDLLNTRLFFRAPSGKVAEWVQKEIGEKRHLKFRDQYSYGVDIIRDGVQFSKDEVSEPLVSYSDIQRLNDLECYATLPGDWPVVKMALKRQELRVIAPARIERHVDEIFDPDIEKALENAEEDVRDLAARAIAKLFGEESTPVAVVPVDNAQSAAAESNADVVTSPSGNTEDTRTSQMQAGNAEPQKDIPLSIEPEKSSSASAPLPERADEAQMVRRREAFSAEIER